MKHLCHAEGCRVSVPPSMFMCKRHWFLLSRELRSKIWAAYVEGQEVTKNPSTEYLEAARAGVAYIKAKETA